MPELPRAIFSAEGDRCISEFTRSDQSVCIVGNMKSGYREDEARTMSMGMIELRTIPKNSFCLFYT
jgi:hypothetical protein